VQGFAQHLAGPKRHVGAGGVPSTEAEPNRHVGAGGVPNTQAPAQAPRVST